jgi:uncharacterized protein (TIGR03000 family)
MFRFARVLGLGLAALLLFAADSSRVQAGENYHNAAPWKQKGFQGYNEPSNAVRPTNAPVAPSTYRLLVTVLQQEYMHDYPGRALMMAHLPENARVYFGDHRTTSTGMLREYISPPLEPGQNYTYTVRVDWVEDGKNVTQTHEFRVRAGIVHCIYLVKAEATLGEDAEVEKNLAKLTPEDRKLAEAQKFCVVQERNRLGSMGPPVKVMIQGQPVFVCCEGCTTKAIKNEDQTLAKVKELKAKVAETNPK